MLLIVVDSYSKWIEAVPMKIMAMARTLHVLSVLFSMFGLPLQLCTDNGPQFTSEEMASFIKRNGIWHMRVTPYHPASNGLAERVVRTVMEGIKAMMGDCKSVEGSLLKFMFNYRSNPHSSTRKTPAEMLMGRNIRSKLHLLLPDKEIAMESRQDREMTGKRVRIFRG